MLVRREALAVLVLPLLVAAVSGPPSAGGLHANDPFGPLLAVVGLLAWAVTGWLLLVLALGAAGRAGSRLADLLLRVLAPASLRSLVGLALGTAVVLAGAPPVAAEQLPAPSVDIDLDWGQPVARPPQPVTTPPRSNPTQRPAVPAPSVSPPEPTAPEPRHEVRVRPGDSLWRIAARSLGPAATDRAVAVAWPRWWHANRELIGTDPDLIHPGAVLVPPSSPTA